MDLRAALEDLRTGALVLIIVACGGAVIAVAISGAPSAAVEWAAGSVGFQSARPLGIVILGAGAICTAVYWTDSRSR